MAGDWLKIEKETPHKPEVRLIADRLGILREVAFDRLFHLWSWVDSMSVDGMWIRFGTRKAVDDYVGFDGFARALESAGWLEVREDGLHFVNGDRHLGVTAKRRASDAKSKKQRRKNVRKMSTEKKTPSSLLFSSLVSVPSGLNTEDFRSAWADWEEQRRALKHKPYTVKGLQGQLNRLEVWGHDRAIAAIRYSIAQSSQGIYEERDRKPAPAKQHRRGDTEHQQPTEIARWE